MSFFEGIGWGVAIGMVVLIGGVLTAAYLTIARRRGYGTREGDMAEIAQELKLHYLAKGHVPEGALKAVATAPSGDDASHVALPLFRRRPGVDVLDNMLESRGDESPQLRIGDWTLEPDPRDMGREVVVTVTLLKCHALDLPPFALRPANLRETNVNEDVAARRFAIRFPSDEAEGIYQEFRENYLLLPDPEVAYGDEDAIRELFGEPLRAFFSERWALSVEGAGQWLLIYREKTQVQWQDLPSLYREAYEIYERFATADRKLAENQARRRRPNPPDAPPPDEEDPDLA